MPHPLPSCTRRTLLGAVTALPVLGRLGTLLAAPLPTVAARPPETPFPEGATILVAGPDGGGLHLWARAMQPAFAQSLAPGTTVHQTDIGGPDGVTGANQFEVRVAPDGRTVLLVPGDAVLAWLVGDPRAKFDVGQWVPVMTCISPGLVVGRPGALASSGVVRIPASQLVGPDLPALLGIELLGVRAQLVPVPSDDAALSAAFRSNQLDAALLCGHRVPERAAKLKAAGAVPLFTFGSIDDAGKPIRCPIFPDVPRLVELYTSLRGVPPSGPLFSAWRAAAAAVQMEFGIVLPQVTPADMVALWRRAGAEAADARDVQALALSLSVQPIGGPAATATAAVVAAHEAAMGALRDWLASRFNWRPS